MQHGYNVQSGKHGRSFQFHTNRLNRMGMIFSSPCAGKPGSYFLVAKLNDGW